MTSDGGKSKAPVVPAQPDLPHELPGADVPSELRGAVLDGLLVTGLDLSGREATRLELIESRCVQIDLSGSDLRNATARDVIVEDGSWANCRAATATFRRVAFENVRLTGASLADSSIEDATFVDCRIDLASFRFARLERVRFQRCRMDECDFYDARLTSVAFDECVLSGATWAGATFARSEMRGCDLSGAINVERLRGVRMPWPDVVGIAGELAAAIGIDITE